VYEQKQWQGTELFRQPLVSFIYERGWRQNFAGAGFPGPEKEFDQAMQYLAPAEGGILVDASCGTGLFTRLFARSQRFKGVVALDFRWGRLEVFSPAATLQGPVHAGVVHTCACAHALWAWQTADMVCCLLCVLQ
jgi:ubiquinone/menaquinone biosynthesis C-methylase UbiE